MKTKLFQAIEESNKILLAGHISPDGDCIGSTLALGKYIEKVYKKKVTIYLEKFPKIYGYLQGQELVTHTFLDQGPFDLCIALDCGDTKRLGPALPFFETATLTFNIDHHISNTYFAKENYVKSDASSTCEVLFDFLDEEQLTKDMAEALYTGLVFDTGMFKHDSTSKRTLEIAGRLITYGFNFSAIIDRIFYEKSYTQSLLLGRALSKSQRCLKDQVIYSFLEIGDFKTCGGTKEETDGIIDQLRVIKGIEVAFFLYEVEKDHYKVSFRSNGAVDVSEIAKFFGGGGHVKASGCSVTGKAEEIIQKIVNQLKNQLN